MKKFTALFLALALLLSLAACAGDTQPKDTTPSTAPTAPSTVPTEPSAPTDPSTAPTDPSSNPSEPSDDPTVPSEPSEDPTDPSEPSKDPTDPSEPSDEIKVITIAEALKLCGEPGNLTTERYYLRGTVVSIDNASYGAMTIKDATGTISVYGTYSADGSINYSQMEEKPFKGDEVLLHGTLQNYNGNTEVKNARLIEFKVVKQEIDESGYTEGSVADARKAATGAKVKVDGVVARITYANGMIPSCFFLIDETNAIYVYDAQLAAQVKEGNKITILATKDFWILETEQYNAQKFGYKGCNQLTDAVLVNNDKGSHSFEKGWIQSSTVKQIMDTPVSTDITTTIFKVNALISKVPGKGFVNYYINDLDGKTGSYVYTQCNGSDFSWLDSFDGKICTVYLSVLNAKSSDSGCVYRFSPVLVLDEKFDTSTVNPAEYAVVYEGLDQFDTLYTGNPALELITSVSSDLLGFKDVKLSYASSDPSVIRIDGNVMNCMKSGSATITVTGTYGSKTCSRTVTITVDIPAPPAEAYPTVADAIAASVGDTVTVKGIVGPSLVNRSGFYLIDDTGIIAVITDKETLAALKLGNEVVMEATRHINTKGGDGYHGQTCLIDAKLITNLYGSHEYADDFFVTGKTVEDFRNLDVAVDYSTTVFVLKATVEVEETKYYSKIALTDGSNKITLYCSSANQYNWLKAYAGQEVTLELAACNWNDKSFYAGCVLAVVHEDGSKEVNQLNFQN